MMVGVLVFTFGEKLDIDVGFNAQTVNITPPTTTEKLNLSYTQMSLLRFRYSFYAVFLIIKILFLFC